MNAAKSELSDLQSDHSKLREDMLETIRASDKEIKLANLIINSSIPGNYNAINNIKKAYNFLHFSDSYLNIIIEAGKYNDDVEEWQLKCIAYTGNNLQVVSVCGENIHLILIIFFVFLC